MNRRCAVSRMRSGGAGTPAQYHLNFPGSSVGRGFGPAVGLPCLPQDLGAICGCSAEQKLGGRAESPLHKIVFRNF